MQIKLCLGIHPVQNGSCVAPSSFNHDDLLHLITTTENVVGIGECGLDFQPCIVSSTHPRFKPNVLNTTTDLNDLKNIQKLVFQGQIEIAKSLNLPLNIHSRNAGHHAIQQVLENNSQSSLFHAFDGKYTYALNAVQKGDHYFSIPPSIVREEGENSSFHKLVKNLPLSNLLLESDSPALGPEKGVGNVPSNIEISLKEIATIKNLDIAHVNEILLENTKKCFKI